MDKYKYIIDDGGANKNEYIIDRSKSQINPYRNFENGCEFIERSSEELVGTLRILDSRWKKKLSEYFKNAL